MGFEKIRCREIKKEKRNPRQQLDITSEGVLCLSLKQTPLSCSLFLPYSCRTKPIFLLRPAQSHSDGLLELSLSLAFWQTQMGSAFRPEVDLWPPYSQRGCLTLCQSCTTALFFLGSLSIGFKQSAPSDRWTKLNRSSIQQADFSIANSPSHVINVRLVCKGVFYTGQQDPVFLIQVRVFFFFFGQKATARDDLIPKCLRLKGYMCVWC